MVKFITDLPLWNPNDTARASLEEDVTTEELASALSEMLTGWAPGPNSLLCEFFKALSTLGEPLPLDWHQVEIVVFVKLGRPSEERTSYCPIYLLNTEVKLLANLLAHRLMKHIQELVHQDQSGFMTHNIQVHNDLAMTDLLERPAALLMVDMDGAFSSVQ
ncbi:hypothetical protein NDU88_001570 [Pleurodeles waltl]|uniref:Reverse transcriptase domain-containing protein n=1 Tax=Pleurodeles waltl TaxID=8319 RepID=A0AAV7W0D0_PLEWA|nr:hypothetical protein NDU88_001570 [Pleurodeles waltl]